MNAFADQQTLDDLNIPGRHKNNSIARLFDAVVTAGGRKVMDELFSRPLVSAVDINKRSNIFKYFGKLGISFPFSDKEFSIMENYLASGNGSKQLAGGWNIIWSKVLELAAQDTEYAQLNKEVCHTIALLNRFHEFAAALPQEESPYQVQLTQIINTFSHPRLRWLKQKKGVKELSLAKLIKYDYLLRNCLHEQMKVLNSLIFHLDVYIAVSAVGQKKGFSYANALSKEEHTLEIANLFHPAVANAVGNTLSLSQRNNVIFLTGANMAGKSTLMKSLGISIYLAHMGFPVAASMMEFSIKDGLYTSINVPDNLDMGYSHFYAEVLRVKTIAEQVAADKNLVVIFDELFKGTNVKDAYDATLSITEAFSENRNCFFVISTHITEVGDSLMERCDNFLFVYLPTIMEGVKPRYTYKLSEGITEDRHGMTIIENEGIIAIINASG
ncbi:MutS-related protein [Pedobacter psychroterrae]|uniref:DNA mismatch repair protein n=1 Tax=Pedobacter psychroterrae TaxID=2530453 RepID=A0A4R0NP68_9SPHI|nr:DNA mismatch repair protein [Pedobacter psychroterrae]TCD00964.1 DNA mismatch repair protein [Pedobacter psychroterrae]